MEPETPFRLALLVVMGTTASIAVRYRLRAARTGERISRRDEGWAMAISLRLAGVALWGATLGYLIGWPLPLGATSYPCPDWLRWCGVGAAAITSLLFLWTLHSLGHNLTDTVVTRRNATLVTHGPYRWVRHPFYLSAALLMGAVTLLAANWLIGATSVAVLSLLALRTPLEEQRLIERFGDAYRDYIRTTGRFWPRWRRQP